MRKIRKKKPIPKLNLIPILDAVFIFIFFLLMSAQFLEIYEIGSDAPAIATIDSEKDDKKPLNLTLKITNSKIVIKTGINGETNSTITKVGAEYNIEKLKKALTKIKLNNIEERSIILSPAKGVKYKQIVKIMDAVTRIEKSLAPLVAKSKKGKTISTKKLFDQIIFETII
jgi:biopolymer transport protein ExbD